MPAPSNTLLYINVQILESLNIFAHLIPRTHFREVLRSVLGPDISLDIDSFR